MSPRFACIRTYLSGELATRRLSCGGCEAAGYGELSAFGKLSPYPRSRALSAI